MSNHQLVLITPETHNVEISLVYATTKNFTNTIIYKQPHCYLHQEAALCLQKAIDVVEPLGLKIKIWDAFRPREAQQKLFDHNPNPMYVSNPATGACPHCRGIAIDLTLIDRFGQELDMGTAFDDFRSLAHHGNDQVSEKAQYNRLLLAGIMNLAGFDPMQSEWWHYQLPNSQKYPKQVNTNNFTGLM